jgi:hypothetical protein
MYFNKKLNPYSLFNVNGRSCVTFNKLFLVYRQLINMLVV